jgi:hypothetical protein
LAFGWKNDVIFFAVTVACFASGSDGGGSGGDDKVKVAATAVETVVVMGKAKEKINAVHVISLDSPQAKKKIKLQEPASPQASPQQPASPQPSPQQHQQHQQQQYLVKRFFVMLKM